MPVKLGNVIPGTVEKNREVAQHLILISMGLALDNASRFKVLAFEDAAESVMLHPVDVSTITDLKKALVSGIGPSTAEAIKEFCERGTTARYEALAAKHPMEALTMTVVDGIGPKGAIKLHQSGIKNFDQLVAAAREGRLDKKMADSVLFAVGKERVPYEEAKWLAGYAVLSLFEKVPTLNTMKFEVCGSIRRKTADSKDVDIVVCVPDPKDAGPVLDAFVTLGTMIKRGEDRAAIRFSHKGRTMQVDLWLVPPESWGAALNYATGSRNHNIELRAKASKAGMLVNEFGIFEVATNKRLGGADEHDLYSLLGIPYVEPENRG